MYAHGVSDFHPPKSQNFKSHSPKSKLELSLNYSYPFWSHVWSITNRKSTLLAFYDYVLATLER